MDDRSLILAFSRLTLMLKSSPRAPLERYAVRIVCRLLGALVEDEHFSEAGVLLELVLPRVDREGRVELLRLCDEFADQLRSGGEMQLANLRYSRRLLSFIFQIRTTLFASDADSAEKLMDCLFMGLRFAELHPDKVEAGNNLQHLYEVHCQIGRLLKSVKNPTAMLLAKDSALKALLAGATGRDNESKKPYLKGLGHFGASLQEGVVDFTGLFERFLELGKSLSLSKGEKERLAEVAAAVRAFVEQSTRRQMDYFPEAADVQRLLDMAVKQSGKSCSLTVLNFTPTSKLVITATAGHYNSGREVVLEVRPRVGSALKSEKVNECVVLSTSEAVEVLKAAKKLWRSLQPGAASKIIPSEKQAAADKTSSRIVGTAAGRRDKGVSTIEADSLVPQDFMLYMPGERSTDQFKGGRLGGQADEAAEMFQGNLQIMSPIALLQTIWLNQKTGTLETADDTSRKALVYVADGLPVHAVSANVSGLDALYEFVLQESGWFKFVPEREHQVNSIKVRMERFLLDAAALLDERNLLKSLGFSFDCAVKVEKSFADRRAFEIGMSGSDLTPHELERLWRLYSACGASSHAQDAIKGSGLAKREWMNALSCLASNKLVSLAAKG